MLYPGLLKAALDAKRSELESFERNSGFQALRYAQALRKFGEGDETDLVARILSRLPQGCVPGAAPTKELNRERALTVEFGQKWHSHEEARRWAVETLRNRVT